MSTWAFLIENAHQSKREVDMYSDYYDLTTQTISKFNTISAIARIRVQLEEIAAFQGSSLVNTQVSAGFLLYDICKALLLATPEIETALGKVVLQDVENFLNGRTLPE
jgi:hypothetical protein